MPDHDVLIVGAGPVGLLLACLLTQNGLRVAVCERRADADTRTRAIGIHRPGLDALDAAGVGAAVRREALRLVGGEVRSRGRTLASLAFAPDRPVMILPQTRTDALLRARLAARAPEALRRGWTVQDVRDDGDVVRVSVGTPDGPHVLTAAVVVAADGVRSRLREDLGLGWRRRGGRATYAMIDVADPEPGDRAVLHCEPAGLVETFPLPGSRRRWVARQGAEVRLDTPQAFREAVETRTGIRLDLTDQGDPTVFVAAQHIAPRVARGRVILLGDAAHEISPIGGQGMNLGWTDAVHLAAELRSALPGRMPDLTRYEQRTRRATRVVQRRSSFYMSMGAPAGIGTVVPRELVIRAMGSRPVRRWSAGIITMRGI
ncbi:FAD-dependent oxidoreductase [Microbacterium sp. SA39]|uniref:FAD-dependent oxidoreductase n=1 Tax=Microbacterium sp. SA39 TaxID=1263625 RepID=UPI0005FA91C6|nr:NAD(P)/FAD-dependent oxidoreductase [Microbacterium sp. SA39]KJQ54860.1 Pentachlorophenol 4-monooxygenase [Microbacterium sp. SA39]